MKHSSPPDNEGSSCSTCLDSNNPNPEVRAYYSIGFGRSALFISFNFLLAAIVHFAYLDAGCRQYELDDDDLYDDGEMSRYYEKGWSKGSDESPDTCKGKVYGLKPSSMVSVLATIGGLVSAVGMPFAGSIVDATDKRHSFGVVCAAFFVLSNFAMIFLTRATWLAMMLLQAIVATFTFNGLVVVIYAYLPELFETEAECVRVTTIGRTYEQAGMLVLIILTTAVSLGLGFDAVGTAIVAQVIAVALGGPSCFNAFQLYKPRKANRALVPGRWLLVDGCYALADIFAQLKNEFPEAAKFLIAQIFLEAGTGTLTIAAVLILDANGLASVVGIYLAVVLVCMMAGPFLHQRIAGSSSILSSLKGSIVAFVTLFTLFVFVARTPAVTWIFAPFTGIIFGWYYPAMNGLLAILVPGGHEGEFAGLNAFTTVVLSWLPPLVITVMNERHLLRVGLLVVPVFWATGLAVVSTIDPGKAAKDIKATLAVRQRYAGPEETKQSGEKGEAESPPL